MVGCLSSTSGRLLSRRGSQEFGCRWLTTKPSASGCEWVTKGTITTVAATAASTRGLNEVERWQAARRVRVRGAELGDTLRLEELRAEADQVCLGRLRAARRGDVGSPACRGLRRAQEQHRPYHQERRGLVPGAGRASAGGDTGAGWIGCEAAR